MDALQRWMDDVVPALGVDPDLVSATTDDVLDMVRDVAHGVVRPGAPLTAYLVGLAAGRAAAEGQDPAAAVRDGLAQVDALVRAWEPTSA
ncbi:MULTISPECIES: DUF6457 domain-containing protein [Cellulomonas]|jgi:hypothetical protein|uniref:DUF6457 domain-containing protein n=1 Tax=Cellulomonas iranensis TaxID=76862 RepID=A0ABU0GRF5_9CELL|nr:MULTISPECIES: DUF6457 domain-containing protein [Cellulomonas]MBO9567206.1 molybdopterin-guanine dinucleotide biosynthesis protein MobA [Cellulomonas iranensis]MDQ0427147.1 hypothetical protein [Cellulomonas iranensis]TFH69611.1 molybdopterin-guanine dinucleotide biosynthesis protein MobA [Cellulomonas sp. HD19AZ1]UCN13181.1 DUF6457 domain-containing protein [Cellulomonas iranensis]